ncbi:MAG: DUF1080 domain-containing protein [Planctomycetaceae bacterium]|nr:DUF1080 domain-containing protein [Planctomycetaceae bacterium]
MARLLLPCLLVAALFSTINFGGENLCANEPAKFQLEEGFELLFNGTDLAGWEGDTSLWKVKEGAIVGDSPGIRKNNFLATTQRYENFELRLQFRLREGTGNSGIQFRSERIPDNHEMIGYQADIGEQYWGCLYDESRRRKILAQAPPELVEEIDKSDWINYTIRAKEGRITLKMNDFTTVNYTEPDPEIPRTGLIALQVHSGGPLKVEFRHIRIKVFD